MLDNDAPDADLTAQQAWLRDGLAASRADDPATWNVVIFHKPAFTSASHEDEVAMRPDAGWDYRGWGADIVIAGHQHIYEDVVVDGLHYLTAGLGGTANYRECPAELREGSRLCLDGTGSSLIEAPPDQFELPYFRPNYPV